MDVPGTHHTPHPARMDIHIARAHVAPDTRHPMPTWVPTGFHPYQARGRHTMPGIVFTNWRETARETMTRHVVVMETNFDVLAILGQLLSDEEYEVSLLCHLPDWREVAELAPDLMVINPAIFPASRFSGPMPDLVALSIVEPIPIIYCTIDPDIAAELGRAGCTTLLEPFDLEDVLTAVSGALSAGR